MPHQHKAWTKSKKMSRRRHKSCAITQTIFPAMRSNLPEEERSKDKYPILTHTSEKLEVAVLKKEG